MAKILLIANTDWYLYRFRISLARFLRKQGLEVILISPGGQYVSKIEAEGFRWLEWQVGRQTVNPFGEIISIFRLMRIFRREKPLLVHLYTIKPVIYGSLAARFAPVSAIVRSITGRGYVFLGQDFRAKFLRPLVKTIYRFALRIGASATIFENESDRQYFLDENFVKPDKSYIIEGVGVDVEYYLPTPEPEGIPVVVLASRMLWDKGVGTFVDTARLLRSKISARFVLIGEPDEGNPASIDSEVLRRWVDEGIVEWWGWQEDMRSVFASCHIVALPSLGEGIPTVLLEAASSGRAIVATDVPGCRDVVVDGRNGLLVPQQDPLALAKAFEKLLNNPDMREAMGKVGRESIKKRFSTARINEETYKIYQSLIMSTK